MIPVLRRLVEVNHRGKVSSASRFLIEYALRGNGIKNWMRGRAAGTRRECFRSLRLEVSSTYPVRGLQTNPPPRAGGPRRMPPGSAARRTAQSPAHGIGRIVVAFHWGTHRVPPAADPDALRTGFDGQFRRHPNKTGCGTGRNRCDQDRLATCPHPISPLPWTSVCHHTAGANPRIGAVPVQPLKAGFAGVGADNEIGLTLEYGPGSIMQAVGGSKP